MRKYPVSKKCVPSVFSAVFIMLVTSSMFSFAQGSTCTPVTDTPFPIDIQIGQEKCFLFPPRTDKVICNVAALNPTANVPIDKSIGVDPTLVITQYFTGPFIGGADIFKETIESVGQKFTMSGTKSTDVMGIHFQFMEDQKAKYDSIDMICEYHTYQPR